MSCPANQPLFPSGDEAIVLPVEYYFYFLFMAASPIVLAFGYQRGWMTIWYSYINSGPLGLRKVGKPGHRNLSKDFAKEDSTRNDDTAGESPWRVEALFDYPIKSTYPVEVQESLVVPTGFEHDRQFCFAQWKEPIPKAGVEVNPGPEPKEGSDAWWNKRPHWSFITQKEFPRLTLVKTEIWVPQNPEHKDYQEKDEFIQSQGCLVVSFPFTPNWTLRTVWSILFAKLKGLSWSAEPQCTFQIPFNPTVEQIEKNEYTRQKLRIWRDEPVGLNMTSSLPQETLDKLRYALGVSNDLALFRVDVTRNRNLYKCAPTEEQLGYQAHIGFQDSYPLHIQNMSSILDAESKISPDQGFKPDSRRYRANIYISGPKAFDEDDWTLVQIGKHKFHVSCRTTRCKLPTNDPDIGNLNWSKQPEPTKWINNNRKIDEGSNSGCLGMELVPTKDAISATIRVGDEVKVLKKGEHFYVKDPSPEGQRPVL